MAEGSASTVNVNNKMNLQRIFTNIFSDIRHDADEAKSRPALNELYRRAGYLIILTYALPWDELFGIKTRGLCHMGDEEFQKTARRINCRAAEIETDADYDEKWGAIEPAAHSYLSHTNVYRLTELSRALAQAHRFVDLRRATK